MTTAERFPAMMFAAGFGTRMKELTRDRPKPLVEVAGKPLIDHALALVSEAGCQPIVANLHYLPHLLETHLRPTGVQTIVETPDILETGGGLRNALPVLGDGPVVTMNTDAIWAGPNPVTLLHQVWDPTKMDALLMCVPLMNAVSHKGTGDFILAENCQMTRGPGVIYGGVQITKSDGLAKISDQKFSLNVLWDDMLAKGRLCGVAYPGKWCDVGTPAGVTDAEQMLRAHHV